jgi:hypothetical protein
MKRPVLLAAGIAAVVCSACGSSSNDGGAAQCIDISGTWTITGLCGIDKCVVSQTNCATDFACSGGTKSYSGTVSGSNFSYSGATIFGVTGDCSGTVSGTSMSGSCSANSGGGSCTFSGTKQ